MAPEDEAERLTMLLLGRRVVRVMRPRPTEVMVEFEDGTRLFLQGDAEGVECSITGGADGS